MAGPLAALRLDRPFVAGYSDGAQIALELGLRHPGLARGIVLGGVVSEPHDEYVAGLHGWGFPAPGAVDLARLEEGFGEEYAATRAAHEHVRGDDDWRRFLEQISELWLGVPRYEDDRLSSISDPVLVAVGDRDDMAGLGQAQRLFLTIPEAELAVVPAGDHGVADRGVYWTIVEDFLDRHGALTPRRTARRTRGADGPGARARPVAPRAIVSRRRPPPARRCRASPSRAWP